MKELHGFKEFFEPCQQAYRYTITTQPTAQTQPELNPNLNSTQPKPELNQNRTQPKLNPSSTKTELNPNQTQPEPELKQNSTQAELNPTQAQLKLNPTQPDSSQPLHQRRRSPLLGLCTRNGGHFWRTAPEMTLFLLLSKLQENIWTEMSTVDPWSCCY